MTRPAAQPNQASPAGGTVRTVPLPGTHRVRSLVFLTLRVFVSLAVILANLWAVAALAIDVPISWLRLPLAIMVTALLSWIAWRFGRRWLAPVLGAGCFVLVLGWWLMLTPSAKRDWQADVAVMPSADINNQQITLHGIRSCVYRSEFDYDTHYHDHVYELDGLQTVDLFLVYWGSPSIAHTMISFGFADGSFLCFSIEVRKEKGENYSAITGFFRQFELIYVIADEQDLIGLRTNYRHGEDVYLYRLNTTPEEARELLLNYLRRVNQLHNNPEWYNALTANCTTAVRMQRRAVDRTPWDWRILLNGHLDELLYERGLIDTSLPFAELKRHALINSRAQAVGQGDVFSQQIRMNITSGQP